MTPPFNDSAFIERLRLGDEQAFSDLVDRYQGSMLRLAMIFMPNRAIAEEVVQDAWLGVMHGLSTFEGRSSLKTWIFRILTNRAKTRGVRENRTLPFAFTPDTDSDPMASVDSSRFKANGMWDAPPHPWNLDSPEKLLITKQAIQCLEKALHELPPSQRAVVTLRDIEGIDTNDVCNILEISETNQRVLLHRARSRLRAILEDHIG